MWQGSVVSVERDGVCKLVVQMLHTNAVLRLTAPGTNHIKSNQIVCFEFTAYTPPEITVALSLPASVEGAIAPPPAQPRKRTYWSV
jgi:hypothetical protein